MDKTINMTDELVTLTRRQSRLIDKLALQIKIPKSELYVLHYLGSKKTAPSQNKMISDLSNSPAGIAILLTRLTKRNLVRRVHKEDDLRANYVELTEEGKEIAAQAKKIYDKVDEIAIRGLSAEELSLLKKLIHKVEDNYLTKDYSKKNYAD